MKFSTVFCKVFLTQVTCSLADAPNDDGTTIPQTLAEQVASLNGAITDLTNELDSIKEGGSSKDTIESRMDELAGRAVKDLTDLIVVKLGLEYPIPIKDGQTKIATQEELADILNADSGNEELIKLRKFFDTVIAKGNDNLENLYNTISVCKSDGATESQKKFVEILSALKNGQRPINCVLKIRPSDQPLIKNDNAYYESVEDFKRDPQTLELIVEMAKIYETPKAPSKPADGVTSITDPAEAPAPATESEVKEKIANTQMMLWIYLALDVLLIIIAGYLGYAIIVSKNSSNAESELPSQK